MQYANLGKSGLKVSPIALGAMGFGSPAWRSWVLDIEAARPIVAKALEQGINFIDTCDYYSGGESERVLGKLLAEFGARDNVIIATKLGMPMGKGPNHRGYSRKHIVEAIDGSLKRLGTDRIDLCQTHVWDVNTNIEEMVEAFDFVVRQGKVLYVGATDIPCWQLSRAICHARVNGLTRFSTLQHHYNSIWREDERDLIPYCRAEGMGLLPYSPIARGLFGGRSRRLESATERARTDEQAKAWYGRDSDISVVEVIEKLAEELGAQTGQVALAWVRAKSHGAVPIFGATRVEQVDAAIAALQLVLSTEQMERIDRAYQPRARGGHS